MFRALLCPSSGAQDYTVLITTLVVSFCKDGRGSVNVKLWFLVVRWAGHVARMGEEKGVYRFLVGKPEGKRPLGRPRRR